jgi:hypothetical protein
MSWIVEAPNSYPSVFVLISSTVFQIDGSVRTYLPESAMISANDGRDQSAADE